MKKKITLIIVAVLLVISLVVGISYAYWRLTYTAEKINKIASSCFSMEITNEKNSITLDSAYPISDEKGKSLTPYSFTITNTCDLFASYTVNLEMLEGTTLNSNYIKTMINSEAITNLSMLETTDPSIDGAVESRVLFKGSLGSGDSIDYTLRIWMDSETPFDEDSMNKVFQAKITVTGEVSTYSPVENGFTNLAEALLVNEYQTTSLEVAKNKINSKQAVDFTKTAPVINWQESYEKETTTKGIIKADPSTIGSYGVITNATKVMLANDYTFDSATGKYYLVNQELYDPNTIDYNSKTYYLCDGGISGTINNTLSYYNMSSCFTLRKIVGLEEVSDTTFTLADDSVVPVKNYHFTVVNYRAKELESDKSDKGLYETIDSDGTTYYYRGNVSNNYVKFAGFYWRIVKINGDNSIRLLYAGVENSTKRVISNSKYNNTIKDNTYVGYMYSNTIKTSLEETLKNDNDSTIKSVLDNWYITNILNKGFDSYLVDKGFCNDRTIYTGNGYSNTTYYNPSQRNTPTYICADESTNLYTTSNNAKGNKALTYPIGLITVDELTYSGIVKGTLNTLNYAYSTVGYWTISPVRYAGDSQAANIYVFTNKGTFEEYWVNGDFGVRPVIDLKSDTEITGGIGTKNDPFIVK